MVQQFMANPMSELGTVECSQLHWCHGAVLIGDSAHATVPFAGQGMNAALESAAELAEHLGGSVAQGRGFFEHETTPRERQASLELFSRQRKPNVDAMVAMSLANYEVLCHQQGRRAYGWRVRYQQAMSRLLPARYPATLYALLNFSPLQVPAPRPR